MHIGHITLPRRLCWKYWWTFCMPCSTRPQHLIPSTTTCWYVSRSPSEPSFEPGSSPNWRAGWSVCDAVWLGRHKRSCGLACHVGLSWAAYCSSYTLPAWSIPSRDMVSPVCWRHVDTGFLSPWSTDQLQSTLSVCLDAVSDCMRSNSLQLNNARTEILWCSTTRRQNHLPSAAVRVGENHQPCFCLRQLFVTWGFSWTVMSLCGLSRVQCWDDLLVLKQLRSIRRSVSDSVFHSLVVSLVMPRLDYGNALAFSRLQHFSRCSTPPPDWYRLIWAPHMCCETSTASLAAVCRTHRFQVGCAYLGLQMPAWSGGTASFWLHPPHRRLQPPLHLVFSGRRHPRSWWWRRETVRLLRMGHFWPKVEEDILHWTLQVYLQPWHIRLTNSQVQWNNAK